MRSFRLFLAFLALPALAGAATGIRHDPHIVPNENRNAAGQLRNGVLSVTLEATAGVWRPEGGSGPGLRVFAFRSDGGPPSIPGPLLRVPAGTELRITLRNSLDRPLLVRGLHAHDGGSADSVDLAAGETREVRFRATTPGTHFYTGRTEGTRVNVAVGNDSQLAGAFVVDPAETVVPDDRIMMIGEWVDLADTIGTGAEEPRRPMRL